MNFQGTLTMTFVRKEIQYFDAQPPAKSLELSPI
jgi:hypothetical protein